MVGLSLEGCRNDGVISENDEWSENSGDNEGLSGLLENGWGDAFVPP